MEKQVIYNELVESFIQCKNKAFQKYVNESGNKTEFELLESDLYKLYKKTSFLRFICRFLMINFFQNTIS